ESDALARRDFHLVWRAGGHKEIIPRPHGRIGAALDRSAALFPWRRHLGVDRGPTGYERRLAFLHEQIVVPVGMDFRLAVLVADGVDDLVAVMLGQHHLGIKRA